MILFIASGLLFAFCCVVVVWFVGWVVPCGLCVGFGWGGVVVY